MRLANWKATICAFQLKEQVPTYEASDSIIIARAKRAVWVFGFDDHAPTALLTYRTGDIQEQFNGSRVERLRAVAGDAGCHACHTQGSCTLRCPKQIAPTAGIAGLKRMVARAAVKGEL